MPTEVIFDRLASREYLKARRWYAARADWPDPIKSRLWITTKRSSGGNK